MDQNIKLALAAQVNPQLIPYLQQSSVPFNTIDDHLYEVVCPSCGGTATILAISTETHCEQWHCKCGQYGGTLKFAQYHLGLENEEDVLIKVCKTLGVHIPVLQTITVAELMAMDLPQIAQLIEGILTPGLYILAGAPKVGKSWFALQLAHHISTGTVLWDRRVQQSDVLYMSLEDNLPRIRSRLTTMCGSNTGNISFCIRADTLDMQLDEEITDYLANHPNTKVVIIDTLAKVRGTPTTSNAYTADYDTMGTLKRIADQFGIAIIVVHHTRKQDADDVMQLVSGTNGLTGCADGTMVLVRQDRASRDAILSITGRDVADTRINLRQDNTTMCWQYMGDADTTPTYKQDPVLVAIADLVETIGTWQGTATDLAEQLAIAEGISINPNVLSRRLTHHCNTLADQYGICYTRQRSGNTKNIMLQVIAPADDTDLDVSDISD